MAIGASYWSSVFVLSGWLGGWISGDLLGCYAAFDLSVLSAEFSLLIFLPEAAACGSFFEDGAAAIGFGG